MNLSVDEQTQLLIKQLSENLHISQQEFISLAVMEYAKLLSPPTKIATVAIRELIGTLNNSPHFKDNPVIIQRRLREEWDE
jgi:predicted nucleic-acid-binding protein